MTVQEEIAAIVAAVRSHQWTPELFERVCTMLPYADIFNILRRELSPNEYIQLDLEYCEYIRPGHRELINWIAKEREVRECQEKQVELLNRKRQLLRQKLRTSTGN